jgi:hypothetical protein
LQKHSFLHTIAQRLGSRAKLTYPDDRSVLLPLTTPPSLELTPLPLLLSLSPNLSPRIASFDIMWIMKHRRIISKESEKCRGIDDDRLDGRHDRDLELEPEEFGEDEDEGEEDDFDESDLLELLGEEEDFEAEEVALQQEEQWSSGQVPLGL